MKQGWIFDLAIGAAAGFFGGLVGLGGGIVMVPLLVAAGLTQHRAHGTSLAALVATGLAGAATYALSGAVDLIAAASLALPAMVTAGRGAHFAHRLPAVRLKRWFGIFQLFIAALLIAKPWLLQQGAQPGIAVKVLALSAAGAFTGFLSGMMGVGGGSVMVPAMVLLAGMGQHVAQGSSLLAMIPAGISGATAHWRLGNVAKQSLLRLIPGVAAGTFAGGMAASAINAEALRLVFAAVLIVMGARYAMAKEARPA